MAKPASAASNAKPITPEGLIDPETGKPLTQEQVLRYQLDLLAEIGGRLSSENDIVFEGTKFIIPARLNLREAVTFLDKRADDEESMINFSRTYKYRPYDGAHATALAIRERFGFTQGKTIRTFFGNRPPQLVDIQTGPGSNDRMTVPWGAMILPGLQDATLHLGSTRDAELGMVFSITVECRRKDRFTVEGLFTVIQNILETNSIYRGKAIDGAETPGFIDTSGLDPDDVVYTETVMQQMEANIFSPIEHANALMKLGMPGKRVVLLTGPYGTGKTLGGALTAMKAQENGFTFIGCRPGKDDPFQVLTTARIYQPAVVFIEDVDTFTGPGADKDAVTQVLDAFDGINTKGLKMIMVLTTNHPELIHKGMLRPGRLDAVVHIGNMDRGGVERLAKRVIGDNLDPETDFDQVFKAIDGYTPAFVKEAFDRAVRYSVARNGGKLGLLSTSDLVGAANGMRDHLELMEGAKEHRVLPGLDGKFAELMRSEINQLIDGAAVVYDGDYVGSISTNE